MAQAAEPDDRYARPGPGNDPRYASLRETFREAFGADEAHHDALRENPIHVVQAPGRVNLIGEHVDYNDGIVVPMAIQPRITFAISARTDGQVRVQSEEFPNDDVIFEIDDEASGEPAWSNYIRGPIAIMGRRGMVLTGMNCYLMNSLPSGAGLSSSAALEVGTVVAMLYLGGGDMSCMEIAKLCREAENQVVGVPVGIMDMAAVACAREDHALMIDCRTLETTHVPLDPEQVAVVVCDTKAPHALTEGEYEQRQQQCQAAARELGVDSLRDVSQEKLSQAEGKLDEMHLRRARHVVTEIGRARRFVEALRGGDFEQAGELMYASHQSLRTDYEVSTAELDFLVEVARGVKGVYGSRMTGAGFGGCTVTLCRPDAADRLQNELGRQYKEEFGVETVPFLTKAAAGARVVD